MWKRSLQTRKWLWVSRQTGNVQLGSSALPFHSGMRDRPGQCDYVVLLKLQVSWFGRVCPCLCESTNPPARPPAFFFKSFEIYTIMALSLQFYFKRHIEKGEAEWLDSTVHLVHCCSRATEPSFRSLSFFFALTSQLKWNILQIRASMFRRGAVKSFDSHK